MKVIFCNKIFYALATLIFYIAAPEWGLCIRVDTEKYFLPPQSPENVAQETEVPFRLLRELKVTRNFPILTPVMPLSKVSPRYLNSGTSLICLPCRYMVGGLPGSNVPFSIIITVFRADSFILCFSHQSSTRFITACPFSWSSLLDFPSIMIGPSSA